MDAGLIFQQRKGDDMITIILVLCLVGFLCWVVSTAPIPIHPWFKTIIIGVIVFCAIVWTLNRLGVHTGIPIGL